MSALAFSFNGQTSGDVTLPQPERTRLVPLRAGIVGLWQFDDHEFWFHKGRLLLRGENGMGKSKALEVLLPFLLDADLRPERLDPFGDRARSMRWNLLGDDGSSGLGYSWLELGRFDETGEPTFVTIGAGLRATARTSDVDVWYFVAHGRRGIEFDVWDDRVAHTKERLRAALEGCGVVYETKARYRQAVDAALFDLGAERYDALIELLLQLRRPQLSNTLDAAELSRLLTMSLPPLEPSKVERLADALESLERIDSEISGLERSHSVLGAFLQEYKTYAALEARRVGAGVRRTASRLYDVTKRENQAREQLASAREGIAEVEAQRDDTRRDMGAAGAELRTLENSEAMQSALALQRLKEDAEAAAGATARAQQARERAGELLGRRLSERDAADARAASAGDALDAAAQSARERAAAAAFADRHAAHQEAIVADPDAARATALGIVDERRRALRGLQALARDAQRAGAVVADRRRELQAAAADADEADAAAASAREQVEAACAGFAEEIASWAGALSVLEVDGWGRDELVDAAHAGAPEAVHDAVARLARAAADQLIAERARLVARADALDQDIGALNDERERIAAARDDGPARRRERPQREVMAGAPLWKLCEFAPHVSEDDAARLEAALDDAGLLDAWVTPEATLVDPDTLDAFLLPSAAPGPNLADVLVPAPDAAVGAAVIGSVLASISLGDGGDHRVGLDGRWALGPLVGASAKPAAEHIGAVARQRARAARLAGIDVRIEELAELAATLRGDVEELERRIATVERERAGCPSGEAIAEARVSERVAAAQLAAARQRLSAAQQRLAAAERRQGEADAALAAEAQRWGLGSQIERLGDLERATEAYRDALVELLDAARRAKEAIAAAEGAGREAAEAEVAAARANEELAQARDRAAAAAAEARTLEEMAGAEVKDVLARIDEVKDRISTLDDRSRSLERRHTELVAVAAAAEERLSTAGRDRLEREQERDEACARLDALRLHGLLGLVMETGDAGERYGPRRALETARAVQQTWGDAPGEDELSDSKNKVLTFYNDLGRQLPGDFDPGAEQPGSLFVVKIGFNALRYEVNELVAFLAAELDVRKSAFEAEERRVIEDFILKELGLHLQERISEAQEMVAEMNAQLRSHPTASGMRLELRWRPRVAEIGGIGDAMRLLRKDLALMDDGEIAALVGFLQERISQARSDESVGRYAEHLAAALDYREWFTFEVVQHKDGRTETLTRRRHARGSGGEKSVALHLPLFAAAAAHYRSAAEYAPRLVMLDEAFAGIDHNMRGSCMALLQAFDLDFMMTSHDEWGFHSQIDGLATYQLARDPGVPGVAAIRFVWDGAAAHQDDPFFGHEALPSAT